MGHPLRLTAIEHSTALPLAGEIEKATQLSAEQSSKLLFDATERIRRALRLESLPAAWTGGNIQFRNVAGMIRLASGVELEIAPKFLGAARGWREDFFLLATLSRHGRLLEGEDLSSSSARVSDLATLIGRSFAQMCRRNQRRPLRVYRRMPTTDYGIVGDVEPEEILNPGENGFRQKVTKYTLSNPYNAVIAAAATKLAPIVSDGETQASLNRIAAQLPPQPRVGRFLVDRPLPSRSRAWQPAYDLAIDILRGFGGSFDPKDFAAPGFVMNTWQIWESLVTLALRLGFGRETVSVQRQYPLGNRYHHGNVTTISVKPDCALSLTQADGNRKRVLVDAKYKGGYDRPHRAVLNNDIYEVLAFSQATGVKDTVLVYPSTVGGGSNAEKMKAGHACVFTTVQISDVCIQAIEIGVCGISTKGGLRSFANGLSRVIRSLDFSRGC